MSMASTGLEAFAIPPCPWGAMAETAPCLSGKRFIFLVMQRPAFNISVYKTQIRGIWKMEAEVPASIADTNRKVNVKSLFDGNGKFGPSHIDQ